MNDTVQKLEEILLASGLVWQKTYNPSSNTYVFMIQEDSK